MDDDDGCGGGGWHLNGHDDNTDMMAIRTATMTDDGWWMVDGG